MRIVSYTLGFLIVVFVVYFMLSLPPSSEGTYKGMKGRWYESTYGNKVFVSDDDEQETR